MREFRREVNLAQEALCAECVRDVRPYQLEGNEAAMLDVMREIDRGRAAGAELALDAIAVTQCVPKAFDHPRFPTVSRMVSRCPRVRAIVSYGIRATVRWQDERAACGDRGKSQPPTARLSGDE